MKNEDQWPNDLELDWNSLISRLGIVADELIKLGESKARIDIFRALRELMQQKDADGDAIAADVINWVWLQLADEIPLDGPSGFKYWPPKNFRDTANGE